MCRCAGMTLSSEVTMLQPVKPPPPRPSAPPSRPSAPPMVPPPRPAPPPPRPEPPQPAKTAPEAAKPKPAGFSDLFCAPPDPDIATDIPISLSSGSLVTASGKRVGKARGSLSQSRVRGGRPGAASSQPRVRGGGGRRQVHKMFCLANKDQIF